MMKSVANSMMKSFLILALTVVGLSVHAEDEMLDLIGGAPKPAKKSAPVAVKPKATPRPETPIEKIVGNATAEQNIFITFFDSGDMAKSLYQWPSAFDRTAFAKTPTGRALNAYLLYKNGLKVVGVENLLAIDKPEQISKILMEMWKKDLPIHDETWGLVDVVKWNPAWSNEDLFGPIAEIRVRSRQVYGSDRVAQLKELMKKTEPDTAERAWLSWQLVIALSTGSDPGTAGKALAVLMKAKNNPVSQALMDVTAARLLYQNGFLDAAIKYYSQVPKSSDYWFDAQEETGWSFIRKGEPQNTIAVTKTLSQPEFTALIGPEPLFLQSLAQLKVCDYPSVISTLNAFRDRFKTRAKDLMELADQSDNKDIEAYIARAKSGTPSLKALGAQATKLPRFVTRDEVLSQAIATQKALESEAKIASDLYAKSMTEGTAQVGFQGRIEEMHKAVDARALEARGTSYNRVKTLASEEVTEISQILNKLHIVEAELLEQLSMAKRVTDVTKNEKTVVKAGTTGSTDRDRITFPAEQETWFDELANYKVDIKKGCQAANSAK